MAKRRTPEQWQVLFAEYQTSGLTQAKFCRQHGLNPKYFSLRRQQFIGHQRKQPASGFIQVKPPESESSAKVSLHYQGMVICFAQADARFITDIVKSLA